MLKLRTFKDLLRSHLSKRKRRGRARQGLMALAFSAILLASQGSQILAQRSLAASPPPTTTLSRTVSQIFQQGQSRYEQGDYAAAIAELQAAIRAYQQQGLILEQAIALSNLSLTYQKLGQWSEAESAINQSLALLSQTKSDPGTQAAILDIQGNFQLETGQAEQALTTWQKSAQNYQQIKDSDSLVRNRINQAQALRILGFYRRALDLLETTSVQAADEANSPAKATRLRLLGDALRLAGRPEEANQQLNASLKIARQLNDLKLVSLAYLSLANTARANPNHPNVPISIYATPGKPIQVSETAQGLYIEAMASAADPEIKTQILVNQFTLFTQEQRWDLARQTWQILRPRFNQLSPNRPNLYLKLNAIQTVLEQHGPDQKALEIAHPVLNIALTELEPLLNDALQEAQQLGDRRSEAHVLGTLGQLREQQNQPQAGIRLTRAALLLAQALDAPDIRYRLSWQLGRLLRQQGETKTAIAAYDAAIEDLQALRQDLVSINRDIQFSFKESIEPVYRESVSLLVEASDQHQPPDNRNATLNQARQRIEALQLAELDNFFREACLDGQTVLLDQVVDQDNPTTAIIYPIILADHLEVIVKIPGQPLQHHAVQASKENVEDLLRSLRQDLPDITQGTAIRQQANLAYQWLIAPIETQLEDSQVETLVFVLDGAFRNVPMAVLYDGEQYLIEKYALGVNLGLQLQAPKALAQEKLNVLAAGLIDPPEAFRDFPPLPSIEQEFQLIDATGVTNEQLLNKAFTRQRIAEKVKAEPFNVLHLATHGQFSSNADDTFLLAADGPIHVGELDQLLRDRNRDEAIELLILSACQTAEGDDRAALGLAGVAVKAGARSTLASLWQVDDLATAMVIGQFYDQLNQKGLSKAEALRQSQLALLGDEDLRDPAYWAPYIIVGNWL